MGYNNYRGWFNYDQNASETHSMEPLYIKKGGVFSTKVSYFEILNDYFNNYNIEPSWIYGNGMWGHVDAETGRWTGLIGLVKSLKH